MEGKKACGTIVCSGELDPELLTLAAGGKSIEYGKQIVDPIQLLDVATTALAKASFFCKLVEFGVAAENPQVRSGLLGRMLRRRCKG